MAQKAGTGALATPETGPVGTGVAAAGLVEAATGLVLTSNATVNLVVGNNYGKGTAPNDGDAKPHGSEDHNKAIDDHIQTAKDQGATNVRKNRFKLMLMVIEWVITAQMFSMI